MKKLFAGVAIVDVTPQKPMFLHGYPHVERTSEGTHDPLYASALIIDNGENQIGFCAVDVIFISKEITIQVREQVEKTTGIKGENLMISASHTHSGPVIVTDIFYDPVVPEADPEYIKYLVHKISEVFIEAFKNKRRCKIAITSADSTGVGGNRHSISGAIDPEVPIVVLKDFNTGDIFGLSIIHCMHPTVLHEDSKLFSADFPGYTRKYINEKLGEDVVLLYQTGPSGNQSPRHFIDSNTFDEAKRLGFILGKRITDSVLQLKETDFHDWCTLQIRQSNLDLPRKKFMSLKDAEAKVAYVKNKLHTMRIKGEPATEIRTVECDWFGAEENLKLTKMWINGDLEKVYGSILPAEISSISLGEFYFVFLPGELFVEYSLKIKEKLPKKVFVSTLSNGVLGGYIVTEKAEKEGGYEASNSVFSAEGGKLIIEKVYEMLS
ncbi:neutral/alkaline non-lysosomal ceramidase N-terminal domain-containing protein [Maribacter sp. MMG018]|uniref:neutral/alkaline non-lysosomal ceramidase N-terminal domain-containing protein n=1 Tax=Maribacter sp. MMG018 TaxID=2822688 RepID=UPI001B387071|nr:neutral/alkaline non-lysosomal ceramidase N-terminal domain-containing protein [Maribacter sp. MMG018]MBQ4915837.1 neutral/alkaline non-lysosomal ceramidase N-terminal domain-containing protein [Maribacter sp. MMG018]